jgi:hypothetical protein
LLAILGLSISLIGCGGNDKKETKKDESKKEKAE